MPGRKLNRNEVALDAFWKNPGVDMSLLRSIEIAEVSRGAGGVGIRGINNVIVPFRYPVTVICGRNGVGKTTFLSLAALAFHSPTGWFVHWGNTNFHRMRGDRTYYTFSDFFIQSPSEAPLTNVAITWRYWRLDKEISLVFNRKKKWAQKYTRRPERPVDFLPLSRSLPAYEISSVRSTFLLRGTLQSELLNEQFRGYLSFIMGKQYRQAEIQKSRRYFLQKCDSTVPYTAFNMGGGESCMIILLHALQRMPNGGFLVVEEIETGLHPQAQKRLAEVLIKIALHKQIQLVCSSHSEVFISALPQIALLLLQKNDSHSIVEAPTVSLVMSEMIGEVRPELMIYCEDKVARILIEEALPYEIRKRVEVKEIGSDVFVIRQGVAHIRSTNPIPCLCVLDGDCTREGVLGCIRSEARGEEFTLENLILPGPLPPERWILEQLNIPDYEREFIRQFNCSTEDARGHVIALRVDLDHHDLGYSLYRRTNCDEVDCVRRVMRAVTPRHPQLDELRTRVGSLLGA